MEYLMEVKNEELLLNEEFAENLKEFLKLQEKLELALKEVKQGALDYLEETGKTSVEISGIKFEYRKGSTRTTLDSKKLKEEQPDIYEAYSKTTDVASTVVVKLC